MNKIDIFLSIILLVVIIDIFMLRRKVKKMEALTDLIKTQKKFNDKTESFAKKATEAIIAIENQIERIKERL